MLHSWPTTMSDETTDASLSDAGALVARQRKVVRSVCRYCGREIVGLKVKRFCDGTCQRASHRLRNRDARRQDGSAPKVDQFYGSLGSDNETA
jgi:hypothetical protein